MSHSNIGLIGLAVMGQNLARNIERNGYKISVYNRTTSKMTDFINEFGGESTGFTGCETLEDFVNSLEKPRKIITLIKAGPAVDATIESLLPYLDEGDIIMDGGNSYYEDTIRRTKELTEKGIRYMGVGVSGGEEGALNGPSIMPGGSQDSWNEVKEILQTISAKAEGEPCCDYVGNDGAGHYVKMVHNGIEYGDMELICETYNIMKRVLGMNNEEIADVFERWNKGKLDSFLIEITYKVLRKKDDQSEGYVVDAIMDKAGNKGTGKWTAIDALKLGISLPTVTSAVYERFISTFKEERGRAAKVYPQKECTDQHDKEAIINQLENALYAAKVAAYAQGMAMIKEAAKEYNWNIHLGNTAKLWRAGCIIRAKLLKHISDAYADNNDLENLLLDPNFEKEMKASENDWREAIVLAIKHGVPVPALSSSLAYFDSYRSETLPMNLLQGLRDFFGAHTYERIDIDGVFHTEWE